MEEMKERAAAARFGEVYEISKADWVREVTDASKEVCVVAHLYEDSIVECRVMEVGDERVLTCSYFCGGI